MPAQQRITNYDVSQIFLGRNFYKDKQYTNSTGSAVTILPGTLLGTILATNLLLPMVSTATDGSEYPVGIAMDTFVIANGASATITFCYAGEVNQSKVIFYNGTDTLATAIGSQGTGGGTYEDLIIRNTDIKLIPTIELSIQDPNQ